jgi:hypothetical protein
MIDSKEPLLWITHSSGLYYGLTILFLLRVFIFYSNQIFGHIKVLQSVQQGQSQHYVPMPL